MAQRLKQRMHAKHAWRLTREAETEAAKAKATTTATISAVVTLRMMEIPAYDGLRSKIDKVSSRSPSCGGK